MRRFKTAIAVFTLVVSQSATAQSDECAIWLCLPGGFPLGCAAAAAAMAKRVASLKPPLPPWGSCAVEAGDGGMRAHTGAAAWIGEPVEICTDMKSTPTGERCAAWETLPHNFWVDGPECTTHDKTEQRNPPGCTKTGKFVKVFDAHGVQVGKTHYWE